MTTTPTEPIVSDECEPDPYWEMDEQGRADFIAAEDKLPEIERKWAPEIDEVDSLDIQWLIDEVKRLRDVLQGKGAA